MDGLMQKAKEIPAVRLLGESGWSTSCLSQQPLGRAVGRCQVLRQFALGVPEGAAGPVVQQHRHQLGAGQTSSDVQRRVARHAAVHTGTWSTGEEREMASHSQFSAEREHEVMSKAAFTQVSLRIRQERQGINMYWCDFV